MYFEATPLDDVWLIRADLHEDERGGFARTFDADAFAARGLAAAFPQCSLSWNRRRGTLRGMHYQVAPHEEAKLVRCTAGRVWDVALDLRPGSPSFGAHFGVELSATNRCALYVPQGCAHGFLTLADDSELLYQISAPHSPQAARGVRYDDPRFAIQWPEPVRVIKARDAGYADFSPADAS